MSEQTQAGWYPDPHGGAQPRWWDGTQWTEHLAPGGAAAPAADVPVVQVPVEVPVVPAPTTAPATPTWGEYAPPSPPAPAAPYSQSAGSPAPGYPGLVTQTPGPATAGIPVLNLWIWLVVFAPYVSLLLLPFFQFPPFPPAAALDDPTVLLEWELGIFLNPVFIAMTVLGWVGTIVAIIAAYRDWKTLIAVGIERPFHWAFVFLNLVVGPVYAIGRAIIVRRRTGRGFAVLWATIAALVVTFVAVGIWSIVFTVNMMNQIMETTGF